MLFNPPNRYLPLSALSLNTVVFCFLENYRVATFEDKILGNPGVTIVAYCIRKGVENL